VAPDGATYTSFITMLCHKHKYEQALEVFRRSLTQDAEVASSVLSMFIPALCKQGINEVLAAAQIAFYLLFEQYL
jgi:pentatricopeptide repeat protein